MFRHLVVTTFIVAVIYIALLIAIKHPLVAMAADTKQVEVVKKDSKRLELVNSVASKEQLKKSVKAQRNEFIDIYGISQSIDLNNGQKEVSALWSKFLSNKSLQNNVNWSKKGVNVYAYYHSFNQDMSEGQLSIGYDGNDLLLNTDSQKISLPKGKSSQYKFNKHTQTAEDKAWQDAYQYKHLIERHTLNASGEIIASDVIIIK